MKEQRHSFGFWLLSAAAVALGLLATWGDAVATFKDLVADWNAVRTAPDPWLELVERYAWFPTFLVLILGLALLVVVGRFLHAKLSTPEEEKALIRQGLTRAAARARKRYLDYLSWDVDQQYKASIYRNILIDLELDEDPKAVEPWSYQFHPDYVSSGTQPAGDPSSIATFDDAYETFDRRLLLLGDPGSGKTTTLLLLAQRLIEEARKDSKAPLPILVNLSGYSGGRGRQGLLGRLGGWGPRPQSGTPRRFERWLEHTLSKLRGAGVSVNDVRQWLEEDRLALLLDGLDEVDPRRAGDLVQHLNEVFFPEHPNIPVVICSRILEYIPLRNRIETRLSLKGAVVLQSLTTPEIHSFLERTGAQGLSEAIKADPDGDLFELARRPLTLSMMVRAYSDLSAEEIASDQPLAVRRAQLFDSYVDRMMQRAVRRRAGLPFDLNPKLDQPLDYSREKLDRYLGWLALRLSERMRTSFPLRGFYEFLADDQAPAEDKWGLPKRIGLLAAGVLGAIAGLSWIMIEGYEVWPLASLLPLVPVVGYAIGSRNDGEPTLTNELVGWVLPSVLSVFLFGKAAATLAESTKNPRLLQPIWMWALFYPFLLVLGYGSWRVITEKEARNVALKSTSFLVGGFLAGATVTGLGTGNLVIGGTVGGLFGLWSLLQRDAISESDVLTGTWFFVLILGSLAFLSWLLSKLIVPLEPGLVLTLTTYVAGLFLAQADLRSLAIPMLLATLLLLGIGQAPAAVIVLAPLPILFLLEDATVWLRGDSGQTHLLDRCSFAWLRLTGTLPWSLRRLFSFCKAALLLERTGNELRFAHRMLRDYFALASLRPILEDPSRLEEAIELLSRQGDAAYDLLEDLTLKHPREEIRLQAARALVYLPSPRVRDFTLGLLDHPGKGLRTIGVEGLALLPRDDVKWRLEELLADDAPEVRTALARSAGKLQVENWSGLDELLRDPDHEVRREALKASRGCRDSSTGDFWQHHPVSTTIPEISLSELEAQSLSKDPDVFWSVCNLLRVDLPWKPQRDSDVPRALRLHHRAFAQCAEDAGVVHQAALGLESIYSSRYRHRIPAKEHTHLTETVLTLLRKQPRKLDDQTLGVRLELLRLISVLPPSERSIQALARALEEGDKKEVNQAIYWFQRVVQRGDGGQRKPDRRIAAALRKAVAKGVVFEQDDAWASLSWLLDDDEGHQTILRGLSSWRTSRRVAALAVARRIDAEPIVERAKKTWHNPLWRLKQWLLRLLIGKETPEAVLTREVLKGELRQERPDRSDRSE